MTPPDADTRLGALERDHARLEERLSTALQDVRALVPVSERMARVESEMGHVAQAIERLGMGLDKVRGEIQDRDDAVSDERKATRQALYGLIGTLGAAIVAGIVAVLTAAG